MAGEVGRMPADKLTKISETQKYQRQKKGKTITEVGRKHEKGHGQICEGHELERRGNLHSMERQKNRVIQQY